MTIDKPDLKKNILNTKVTLVSPVTQKPIEIPNVKVTQLINNLPMGKKPEMKTPVHPGDREMVVLKIIVEVPHVGSKTKEIVMPVRDGSKFCFSTFDENDSCATMLVKCDAFAFQRSSTTLPKRLS